MVEQSLSFERTTHGEVTSAMTEFLILTVIGGLIGSIIGLFIAFGIIIPTIESFLEWRQRKYRKPKDA